MKKLIVLLFVTLAVLLSACGAEGATVPCPQEMGTGNCFLKTDSGPVMENQIPVPYGMGKYSYIVIIGPDRSQLTATVSSGSAFISGQGTSVLTLKRIGDVTTTVSVSVVADSFPIIVSYAAYSIEP